MTEGKGRGKGNASKKHKANSKARYERTLLQTKEKICACPEKKMLCNFMKA